PTMGRNPASDRAPRAHGSQPVGQFFPAYPARRSRPGVSTATVGNPLIAFIPRSPLMPPVPNADLIWQIPVPRTLRYNPYRRLPARAGDCRPLESWARADPEPDHAGEPPAWPPDREKDFSASPAPATRCVHRDGRPMRNGFLGSMTALLAGTSLALAQR